MATRSDSRRGTAESNRPEGDRESGSGGRCVSRGSDTKLILGFWRGAATPQDLLFICTYRLQGESPAVTQNVQLKDSIHLNSSHLLAVFI
jgi:hypothetical protein